MNYYNSSKTRKQEVRLGIQNIQIYPTLFCFIQNRTSDTIVILV